MNEQESKTKVVSSEENATEFIASENFAVEKNTATVSGNAPLPPQKPRNRFMQGLDNYWGITVSKSTFKTEIIAGIVTFMTMIYILFVNADLLAVAGVDKMGGYIMTAMGAFVGTMLMALLAKLPFAQATGMGINATFAYTLVGSTADIGYYEALAIVLCSGFVFVILTVTGARRQIVLSIPKVLNLAMPAAIGLFIAFVGLQNSGLVVKDQNTGVAMLSFNLIHFFKGTSTITAEQMISATITIVTIIAITVLAKKKIKGSVLYGLLIGAGLYFAMVGIGARIQDASCRAVFHKFTDASTLNPLVGFKEFGKHFGRVFTGFAVLGKAQAIMPFITVLVSFLMIDMFNTIGTIVGVTQTMERGTKIIDKDGNLINMNKALLCDSIATCAGAVFGTSTVTTFVESSAGVSAGGRTGLTAFVTASLFLVAMFLSPLANIVPSCATAGVLVYVGVLMMGSVKEIKWSEITDAVPAFLMIAGMSFTYSIPNGIALGFISYTLIKLCTGKMKEIPIVTAIVSVLFVVTYLISQ